MKINYNFDQVNKLLTESHDIALLTVSDPSIDQTAGLLGFAAVLEHEGKAVIPAFSGTVHPEVAILNNTELPGCKRFVN